MDVMQNYQNKNFQNIFKQKISISHHLIKFSCLRENCCVDLNEIQEILIELKHL